MRKPGGAGACHREELRPEGERMRAVKRSDSEASRAETVHLSSIKFIEACYGLFDITCQMAMLLLHKNYLTYFCDNIWRTALIRADLPYKVLYCMRHSFAAWSLTLRIDMLRLVAFMGHRDKKWRSRSTATTWRGWNRTRRKFSTT
jgi:hypothetical protein